MTERSLEGRPNIKVLENLLPISGFGIQEDYKDYFNYIKYPSNPELYFTLKSINDYLKKGIPCVRIRLGGPGSGKTMTTTQDLALKYSVLQKYKLDNEEIKKTLCYVSFESAQHAAKHLIESGKDNVIREFTEKGFEKRELQYSKLYNPTFKKSLQLALQRYPLIDVEAPFLAERGNLEEILSLIPRTSQVYLSYFSPTEGLLIHTIAMRGYKHHYGNISSVAQAIFSGTKVVIDDIQDISSIPGGDRLMISLYYYDELLYAIKHASEVGIYPPNFKPPTEDPTNTHNMKLRREYLDKFHKRWFQKIGIPSSQVSMHTVEYIPHPVMYLNYLYQFDFVQNLATQHELELLKIG